MESNNSKNKQAEGELKGLGERTLSKKLIISENLGLDTSDVKEEKK